MTIISTHNTIQPLHTGKPAWSNSEKFFFRIAFLFFILLIVPLEKEWYARLFSDFSFYKLLSALAGARPGLIDIHTESGKWGLASYTTWGAFLAVSIIGAIIWTFAAQKKGRKEYNVLYYWLRVFVRYRVAIGSIAFGFIKFFPMQMPFPSISNLHTNFGDYAPFKLYWQSVGLSLWYEIFLGTLEILIGVLLFFRSTTAIGAILTAGIFYNIAHANLGYDGGVHVYSSFFVIQALFLLVQYIPDIWKLFIKRQTVVPNHYYPEYTSRSKRFSYILTKSVFIILFLVFTGYNRYDLHYNQGRLKEPIVPGLKGFEGHYLVKTFLKNGSPLSYSPLDSVRWHDAVFERYSTFSYKVYKPFQISIGNGVPDGSDIFKEYEFTGRAGGRVYLYYEIDSLYNDLYLVDKGQNFSTRIKKKLANKDFLNLKQLYTTPLKDTLGILQWHYVKINENAIELSGLDQHQDPINVVLERIPEVYTTGKSWYSENKKFTY
ncbi:hypothetical protein A8C56_10940 [Niabella ginsenosidivorans]|uniref:DoxX family protein n=1 Tax=Niabella ginsenosidivorans TaxID=1176587 RepID=A0A1A9I199_9BACT|nr:hypothetical protein [Niabella ginsenosidivorans]ANH81428.1 hypothetical protein A8C56_10940 [Niabella ginsenosidivorans]